MSDTRIHWKDDEWQLICAELFKTSPIECRSSTLVGIKVADMIAAMHKVIPKARHRAAFNMTKTRVKLLEQMPVFIQVHDTLKAREEARVKEEHEATQNVERKALAPFAALLAEMMFEHLRPMIDAHLAGRPVMSQPFDAVVSHHREATPRKPRVGIIGLLPIQTEAMKAQFPDLDFKFVEKGGNSDEVRGLSNMDAIFGLTQKMAHNAENVLRKAPNAWARYHRVAGKGTTAIKRAVGMWVQNPTTGAQA